ncbi:ComEC family competence protein [Patescibacteria group bacterium]|nr:ComEC family competence protein [Patescibacteria group bacterium]
MPPGDHFFYAALFFLGGVGGASLGLGPWLLVLNAAFLAAFLLIWRSRRERRFFALAALSLLFACGAIYCRASTMAVQDAPVPFGRDVSFTGIVDNDPEISGGSTDAVLRVPEYSGARIIVKLSRYPEYSYGDELRIAGKIERPEPASYATYLLKERVLGTMSFPESSLIASGRTSPLMAWLYRFKDSIVGAFNKALPAEEAALAAGLTVGERGGFTAAFDQAMRQSGTTHLVALSGYNITIITTYVLMFFLLFARRRRAIILTVVAVVLFVLMTGAAASVVRAAIMGLIVVLAKETGRLFDPRNAIALAGVVMVAANPLVLVFDVGFVLSFLALIGLVYLQPALEGLLRRVKGDGLLSWRKNLFTTSAAQFMVLPVLVQNFGGFSPVALLSNVLVLGLIPLTMGLSFLLAGISFVSSFLASIVGILAWPLLKFETAVIDILGSAPLPAWPAIGWAVFVAYYAAIAFFIAWRNKKHPHVEAI